MGGIFDAFGTQVVRVDHPQYETIRVVLTPDRHPDQFTVAILPKLDCVRLRPDKVDSFLTLLLGWIKGQICRGIDRELTTKEDVRQAFLIQDGYLDGTQRAHCFGHVFMSQLASEPSVKLDNEILAEHLFALGSGSPHCHLVFVGRFNMHQFVGILHRAWALYNSIINDSVVVEEDLCRQTKEADS